MYKRQKTDTDVIFSYDADWGNPISHAPYVYDYFSETLRNRDTSNLEARLLSNASQGFDWIIGLSSFEIDETNYRSDDGAYGDPFDGYDIFYSTSSFSSDFSSKSKSIFGSIDLKLDNNFILSFGARWEDWEANYKDSNQESFKPSDNTVSYTHLTLPTKA